jgi:nucleoside 2-deoxyribosyltransferase
MIVYCALPIRGEKIYRDFYSGIIEYVNSLKHTALSELNADFKPAAPLTDSEIFTRDTKWLDKSKVVIAEVSGASTGVGFEVAYALYKKKIPVLALANKEAKTISAMITGCHSELLTLKEYSSLENLKKAVSEFLKKNIE